MKNNYLVYSHILKKDGRRYIGITCQTIKNRWRNNGTGYKTCIHFYRAIQKYGWNNFQHIVLFDNLTKEEAEQKEIELIKKHNTTNRKYGFNVLKGGNTRSDFKHSEEAKKKISNALKGRIAHNKGQKQSKETIEKRRIKLLGHKVNRDALKKIVELKSKKVLCVELNKIFKNENEASMFINGNRHICDVCNGKRNTAGGYHWQFLN